IRATSRRVVVTAGISSETTCKDSCRSCGRTSWNHPMTPATEIIAPRALMEAVVTRPKKIRGRAKARTIGHEVGAGTSTVLLGKFVVTFSAPDNIDDQENGNPGSIHEVPVKR